MIAVLRRRDEIGTCAEEETRTPKVLLVSYFPTELYCSSLLDRYNTTVECTSEVSTPVKSRPPIVSNVLGNDDNDIILISQSG